MAYVAIRSKVQEKAGGGPGKDLETREARFRVVRPWESALVLENGEFYDLGEPLLDADGNDIYIDGLKQYTKKFNKAFGPGLHGGLNLILWLNKLIIVNNLPDEAPLPPLNIEDKAGNTLDLAAGMTWAHVRALNENKKPATYFFNEPSPDGKRPAGPISAAEALYNAIQTAPTRAEAARQLVLITHPEVKKRLHGESDPCASALEPAFFNEVESAVHDRFLERGSRLVQVGVTPNTNADVKAADKIAAAMDRRTDAMLLLEKLRSEEVDSGEQDGDEEEAAAAVALHGVRRAASA